MVAVSHSAYLRALLAFYLGTPYDKARALGQQNCCINVLEFEVESARDGSGGQEGLLAGRKAAALAINDTRHLELASRREGSR